MPNILNRLIEWVSGSLRVFPIILPLLFSCAGVPDAIELRASRVIENVPFYPQKAFQCGPASLAGVLNYWQVAVTPEEIAAEIYSDSARGTLDLDMVSYADRKGISVRQYEGSIEDIKRNIDLGHPLIVLVEYGFWIYQSNHYMVIVGYNEDGILANTGRKQNKSISFKRFLKSWEKTAFWTMLVKSKN